MSASLNVSDAALMDVQSGDPTFAAAEPAAVDVDYSVALQSIVDSARARLEAVGAGLLLPIRGTARYQVTAAAGSFPADAGETAEMDGERIVVRQGSEANAALQRASSVPVSLHGVPLGLLVAVYAKTRKRDTKKSREVMEELAGAAAPALAAARVTGLENQLTELGAIVEVGQVLTGLLDMEDVLSYLVFLAESLVGGHAASVALLTSDRGELVLKNGTGGLRGVEGQSVPVHGSLIGWVVEHEEALLSVRMADDPRGSWSGTQGPGVVVPIMNNGVTIGVFLVARLEDAPPFSEESAVVLQRMAAYAAIAITNAEAHATQRQIADTLRTQATQLEKAYAELSNSQDRLIISEKMAALGRITAGIAHEINSPLGGVLNALRAARGFTEEYRSSVNDPEITPEDHLGIAGDILNTLTTADSAVMKVAQFVRSIKGQTRNGEATNVAFDPAAEVDSTVVLLQHELKRRRVGVFTEMERGHRLTGDQGKFSVVIQNLVSNAIDAYEGRPGEIWVRLHVKDEHVHVSVEDRGSGIPEEIRGRIFDYLFTTKDVGKGTGLGLAMVHSVVTTSFLGEVSLQSEVGTGTTFTLTIPLNPAGTDHHGT